MQTLLRSTTVADLPAPKLASVRSVDTTDSCLRAFFAMSSANILSLPVWDASALAVVGFVDIVDVITTLLACFSATELKEGNIPQVMREGRVYYEVHGRLPNMPEKIKKMTETTVAKIMRPGSFFSITPATSLLDAVNIMVKNSVHRLAVINSSSPSSIDALCRVVTQSDIVHYVQQRMVDNKLGPDTMRCVSKTLADLDLYAKKSGIHSVCNTDPTITAFKVMKEKGCGGVAVVDKDGNLVGNISALDLKLVYWQHHSLNDLFLPISDYMKIMEVYHTNSRYIENRLPAYLPEFRGKEAISCRPKDTLADALQKMILLRIHRIYVVEAGKVAGVVTMTDILAKLLTM